MTLLSGAILFLTNFIILSLFSLGLLFIYHRKRDELDHHRHSRIMKEKDDLEELSDKLLKASELLLKKVDLKEKRLKALIIQLDKRLTSIQVRKVSLLNRAKKNTKDFTSTSLGVRRPQLPLGKTTYQEKQEYLAENSKYKEIYYLADTGVSLVDIARKTGKTKGEIDLVLSLRRATKMS